MKYVEYIQNGTGSTDTSGWNILLGYTPSLTSGVMMRTKIETPNNFFNGDCLIGAKGGNGNFFRFFGYQQNKMTFDCPNDSDGRINCNYTGATEWEISFVSNVLTLKNITADLTVTGTTNRTATFQQEWSVWLNSVRESTKIYYIEAYENGNKVKDYRPAVDNNDVACLYETIGGTYHYNSGDKTLLVGPDLSSITALASKTSLANTGETISISVDCENAWTVSQVDNWLTLSSTGDTGSTTITATAPSYSGATARTDTLTFTDSVTGDEVEITIRQKKYSLGQPVYLGGNEVTELYLGENAISEAYLGDVQVFSSGPFVGLKVSPKTISFNQNVLSINLKVKSSESWTMTVPAWVTASVLTGDTGETTVTLSTTAQTAATIGSIVVTTANYSASASCEYSLGTPMLQIDGVADIPTQFSPYNAYTGNSNYLKYQISAEWTGDRNSSAYLYACRESVPFFSVERFRYNDTPYCNIGNESVSNGPENGGGLAHTWVVEINNGSVVTYIDGVETTTKTISGNWPTENLAFAKYYANNLHINFYGMKFWGANDTLIADFAPDPSGGIIDKVSNIVYPKTGTGTTAYSLIINQ